MLYICYMLKKAISLFILVMYLHGMSGYTMSFHKCSVTGFENVYTGYSLQDPCEGEMDRCQETTTHFEQADCCDLQQTTVSVDDERDINNSKTNITAIQLTQTLFHSCFYQSCFSYFSYNPKATPIKPPDPILTGVFRI